ncbi:MAG: AMP-binding protein, partial [Hyphomicrobium denitrificans]|nr:AMP-binding protein [Hyphomicrobium denitrificans]
MPTVSEAFNMADYAIGRHARVMPDKTALLVCDVENPREPLETWTFGELDRAVRNLAAGLAAKGLRRGDRIGIRLGNSSQSALMFFAAMAGGFIALPLSDQLTASELAALLDDSGAAALATADSPHSVARDGILTLSRDDVAAMIARDTDEPYAPTQRDDP